MVEAGREREEERGLAKRSTSTSSYIDNDAFGLGPHEEPHPAWSAHLRSQLQLNAPHDVTHLDGVDADRDPDFDAHLGAEIGAGLDLGLDAIIDANSHSWARLSSPAKQPLNASSLGQRSGTKLYSKAHLPEAFSPVDHDSTAGVLSSWSEPLSPPRDSGICLDPYDPVFHELYEVQARTSAAQGIEQHLLHNLGAPSDRDPAGEHPRETGKDRDEPPEAGFHSKHHRQKSHKRHRAREHKCAQPDCGYICKKRADLRRHKQRHLPEHERKKFRCFCGNFFTRFDNLQRHQRQCGRSGPAKSIPAHCSQKLVKGGSTESVVTTLNPPTNNAINGPASSQPGAAQERAVAKPDEGPLAADASSRSQIHEPMRNEFELESLSATTDPCLLAPKPSVELQTLDHAHGAVNVRANVQGSRVGDSSLPWLSPPSKKRKLASVVHYAVGKLAHKRYTSERLELTPESHLAIREGSTRLSVADVDHQLRSGSAAAKTPADDGDDEAKEPENNASPSEASNGGNSQGTSDDPINGTVYATESHNGNNDAGKQAKPGVTKIIVPSKPQRGRACIFLGILPYTKRKGADPFTCSGSCETHFESFSEWVNHGVRRHGLSNDRIIKPMSVRNNAVAVGLCKHCWEDCRPEDLQLHTSMDNGCKSRWLTSDDKFEKAGNTFAYFKDCVESTEDTNIARKAAPRSNQGPKRRRTATEPPRKRRRLLKEVEAECSEWEQTARDAETQWQALQKKISELEAENTCLQEENSELRSENEGFRHSRTQAAIHELQQKVKDLEWHQQFGSTDGLLSFANMAQLDMGQAFPPMGGLLGVAGTSKDSGIGTMATGLERHSPEEADTRGKGSFASNVPLGGGHDSFLPDFVEPGLFGGEIADADADADTDVDAG